MNQSSNNQFTEDREEKERIEKLKNAVTTLQSCLQKIVENQKKELQGDEEYQKKFYKLCNDIGVDPFTQKKGFLAGLLNKNLDEYYKALGMRVLNVCLKTRYENSKNGYEASLMISYDYDSKDFHEKNISKIKTELTVLKSNMVDSAISAIKKFVDIDSPGSGIIFTVPVGRVEGIPL